LELQALAGDLVGVQAGQNPAQVAEHVDSGLQAGAVEDQREDGFAQSVLHGRSQIGEPKGGQVLGSGMGGGGLGFAVAPDLLNAQVVPALRPSKPKAGLLGTPLQIGMWQAASGKAGQHFRLGLIPFLPVGRIAFDSRPGASGRAYGADAVEQGQGQAVKLEGATHFAPLAGSGVGAEFKTGRHGVNTPLIGQFHLSKPKSGFHPSKPKSGLPGTPGLLGTPDCGLG
jgi:hypothetical protein